MKKSLFHSLALVVVMALLLSACATPAATTQAPAPTSAPAATAGPKPTTAPPSEMDLLIAAAQAEGTLSTIALPRNWCNYGEVIDSFKAKYGLEVNELNPNAGSGDEIQAIRANRESKGPQAPDVIDVGYAFGANAKAAKLIQPYQVSTWDTIPETAKDPEGYWYGDYYGVMAFMVNTDVVENVPQDWPDLLKPEYKSQIGLSGNPASSNQAIQTVYAATLANGGSLDDVQPGLDFFGQLFLAGNLVPVISNNGLVARGETPIRLTWDYLALGGKDELAGNPPIEVVIPASGRFAGVYVQAISAYAPHPNAAKLWMEHLYSDEGQIMWLKGYCHPIREDDLRARSVVPQELLDKLPSVEGAVFPSAEQLGNARNVITTAWASLGVEIKAAP